MSPFKPLAIAFAASSALGLSACAGGAYTGPVEVTRFVAPQTPGLGEGTIALRFSDELTNEAAREAFRGALSDELSLLGYTVIGNEEIANQIAIVSTSRNALAQSPQQNPVSVGVGGSTGTFGSGLGVGVGINLGGGRRGPNAVTELSVRITSAAGETLWEGRAEQAISVNSDYAEVNASAQALAKALFRDFPGGNGETVSVDVNDL